jgi:hypothetical protein
MSGSGIFAGETNADADAESAAATPGRAASRNYQVLVSPAATSLVMLLLASHAANLLLKKKTLRMALMCCTVKSRVLLWFHKALQKK